MRGTLVRSAIRRESSGITPAYAGNTRMVGLLFCAGWDHPRICGEHSACRYNRAHSSGSPPHMRGTPHTNLPMKATARITPAYAGNTFWKMDAKQILEDHPRICGEHPTGGLSVSGQPGSPPHMRGTQGAKGRDRKSYRITPAYAGNTGAFAPLMRGHGDHPRICGEHMPPCCHSCSAFGSPPHMRGTRRCSGRRATGNRITPAYAGNTLLCNCGGLRRRDHPRICGEH